MNYYINTNTEAYKSGDGSPEKWIEHGYAFTSGGLAYGRKLGELEPGDTLFMYVNGCGIMAVGKVSKRWDKKRYEGDDRLVDKENPEYRICVKWDITLWDNPIEKAVLKGIFGNFGESKWWGWPTLRPINPEIAQQLRDLAEFKDKVNKVKNKVNQVQLEIPPRYKKPLMANIESLDVGYPPENIKEKVRVIWYQIGNLTEIGPAEQGGLKECLNNVEAYADRFRNDADG